MRVALCLMLSFLAGPALALSCMAPDVAHTFNSLNEDPKTYVVVHGTLTFDPSLMPVTDWEHQDATPQETRIPARLNGVSLTEDGFTAPFDRSITFNAVCFGPWCVSASSGSEVMAFVEYINGDYVFGLGPCYFSGFFDPDAATLNAAADCMSGKDCTSKQ